ncbi:DUF397 domain-containing protein [Actinomadura formosensis]|uniref:DUF397 domain-containing protein n=1 Tax=Actinomadura formosensis TaxID=60706 RepID=UPI003D900C96
MGMSIPSSVHWRKSSHSDQEGGNCIEVASWRKSSRSDASGGDCVEVASWRKSSRSDSSGGNCVEVGRGVSVVAVRDSKDPDGPMLTFGRAAFGTLARDIRAGHYDE